MKYVIFHTHFLCLPEVHTTVAQPKEKHCLAEPDYNVLERTDGIFSKKEGKQKKTVFDYSEAVKTIVNLDHKDIVDL